MGIIAVPIALQSLISIGVNMMDTVMLGALGEVALSASSLANQFINIYHVCCMGIGMGASVMVARFWGMRDSQSLKQSITIMLRLCIVFGLLFMAATILAPGALMRIYTPDPDIIREGIRAHLSFAGAVAYLYDCAKKRGAGQNTAHLLQRQFYGEPVF